MSCGFLALSCHTMKYKLSLIIWNRYSMTVSHQERVVSNCSKGKKKKTWERIKSYLEIVKFPPIVAYYSCIRRDAYYIAMTVRLKSEPVITLLEPMRRGKELICHENRRKLKVFRSDMWSHTFKEEELSQNWEILNRTEQYWNRPFLWL